MNKDVDTIFAVPEKNAVGTNALDNAITLIWLIDGKIRYETLSKDFMEDIYGGKMVFMPEFSKDTIGYVQTRSFLLFNIKDKSFNDFLIGKILGIEIDDVVAIDSKRKTFLFQLDYLLGMTKNLKVLKLIDLSTNEPKELATYSIDKDPKYAQLGTTTFFFTEHEGKRKLHVLNDRLKPIEHPLCHLYNTNNEDFGQFSLPIIHPNLPFGLISEDNPKLSENLTTWVASWGGVNRKVEMFKMFGDNLTGSFQFSPDGKWMLLKDYTIKDYLLMVMAVDEKLPYYLGPPIILSCDEVMPRDLNGRIAWISNPLSLVITFNDRLIKWEISKDNIR